MTACLLNCASWALPRGSASAPGQWWDPIVGAVFLYALVGVVVIFVQEWRAWRHRS